MEWYRVRWNDDTVVDKAGPYREAVEQYTRVISLDPEDNMVGHRLPR